MEVSNGYVIDDEIVYKEDEDEITEDIEVKDDGIKEIAPTFIKQPESPTAEEWRNHQRLHYPFKNLCPICIQAKAKATPHKRRKRKEVKERGVLVIAMDYMSMTKNPKAEHLVYPIIVIKDSKSGGIWTIPTSRKKVQEDKTFWREW